MGQPDNAAGLQGGGSHVDVVDARAYQELWLTLARRDWASMVLVPAEPGGSAAPIARALAEVGKRLSQVPVRAVTASSLEYGTALTLADLPSFVDRHRLAPAGGGPTVDVPPPAVRKVEAGAGPLADWAGPPDQALALTSAARLIISVPAVVSEPLGLATTQNADLIVLCVERGQTRIANARRTLELIGRERVAGCLLLG